MDSVPDLDLVAELVDGVSSPRVKRDIFVVLRVTADSSAAVIGSPIDPGVSASCIRSPAPDASAQCSRCSTPDVPAKILDVRHAIIQLWLAPNSKPSPPSVVRNEFELQSCSTGLAVCHSHHPRAIRQNAGHTDITEWWRQDPVSRSQPEHTHYDTPIG